MRLSGFLALLPVIGFISYLGFKCNSVASRNVSRNLSHAVNFPETGRDLLNTFSVFNELFDQEIIQITGCTVIIPGASEHKSYTKFKTCLLKDTQFWKNEERTIVVYFDINNEKSGNVTVVWSSLSKLNLLRSIFKSQNRSNKFTVKMDSSEIFSELVEALTHFPEASSVQESLFNVSQLNTNEIDVHITPYEDKRDEFLVHLKLLKSEKVIYNMDVVTNYSPDNTDDFFIEPAVNFYE